jgi:hypothetical protein
MSTAKLGRPAISAAFAIILGAIASLAEDKPPRTVQENQPEAKIDPEEAKIANWTEALAWLTGVLAVVSTVQIIFLFRADKTANINARAASRGAEAAMKAATVGQEQLLLARETAETPLRAYLGVSSVELNTYANELSFTVGNNGQTPAKSVTVEWQRDALGDPRGTPAKIEIIKPSSIQIAPQSWQKYVFRDADLADAFRAPGGPSEVNVRIEIGFIDWFEKQRTCLLTCVLAPTRIVDWIYEAQ